MKPMDDNDDKALDALFAAGRADDALDEAFMARLMADAEAGAAQHIMPIETSTPPKPPASWLRWLPASGLPAATLAGFWIGMILPASDFGTTYLFDIEASGTDIAGCVPSFGVGEFVEDDG